MHLSRIALFLLLMSPALLAERPKFSGPQAGESVAPFKARVVFGEDAGKDVEVMKRSVAESNLDATAGVANGNPSLLIFVHQINRPAIGLSRMLVDFANSKKAAGLNTDVVFLTNDLTETEAWMKRARRALPKVRSMVSIDGIEGPGSYGLNRLMTMTVLVVKDGIVTENFALTQPSVNVDGPKIGHAILKVLKDPPKVPPTLKEMGYNDTRRGRAMMQPAQERTYRGMMAPVIQKTATVEEVEKAAKAVEDFARKTPWFRDKVGTAAGLIVGGGKLSNYGTETAQTYLKKWSEAYKPKKMAESAVETPMKEEAAKSEKVESESTSDK